LWLFPAISKQNQEDDMFQGFRFGVGMQLKISAVMATAILALGVSAYAQRAATGEPGVVRRYRQEQIQSNTRIRDQV
jgi:hypothetical protein